MCYYVVLVNLSHALTCLFIHILTALVLRVCGWERGRERMLVKPEVVYCKDSMGRSWCSTYGYGMYWSGLVLGSVTSIFFLDAVNSKIFLWVELSGANLQINDWWYWSSRFPSCAASVQFQLYWSVCSSVSYFADSDVHPAGVTSIYHGFYQACRAAMLICWENTQDNSF